MLRCSPRFTTTVCAWKSAGFPMPYRHETLEMTITSRLPESRADAALRRSFSISSLMLRSFSMYVSVTGRYASG